ncbi:MAG TPA: SGNH/GDSL hydrolase family protein [Candidatus Obscuribacterales bacterium]
MDVKTGSLDIQPAWHHFLNQATRFRHALAEGAAQVAGDVKDHAEAFWVDSTDFVARQTQPVLPLVQHEDSPKLTVGKKVLIIGDSQTVGPYGKTLDQLARASGAKVSTHASWGASPHWFFNGQETSKYWTRDVAGHPDTRKHTETPLLNELLAAERPDVVVVTMGGNMIAGNASQSEVTSQVSQIGNAVSASGAQLIWVGPPKYDPQKRSPEVVEQFYQKLRNIVPEYGTLIDSRPHIEEYSGSDGLHYSGAKGERIAREWATGVFQEIQKLP